MHHKHQNSTQQQAKPLLEVKVPFTHVLLLRDAARQEQQQQGDSSKYWRQFKQLWLGCVCLNVFTGRDPKWLFSEQWPESFGLPVLEPVPR